MIRTGAIAIGLICLLLAALPAQAQEGGGEAQALLEHGIKSQTSGQHRLAVQTLTRALNAEGLAPNEVARALYFRGLAYKEINRPEQAIADLTGALFLSGLSDKERTAAEQARQAAFREGGTTAVASADRAGDAPAQGSAPAAQGPSFSTRVETASAEPPAAPQPAPPAFSTSVSREAPQPQQKVAAAPPPPTSFSTRVDVAPQSPPPPPAPVAPPPSFRTTIAPSAEPAPPPPPPQPAPAPQRAAQPPSWSTSVGSEQPPAVPQPEAESGGSRLGRFFSNITDNLTGDGSGAESAKQSGAPATSWVQTTRVDSSGRQQTAAAPPAPAPSAPPQPATGGSYRIQVAALPSEEEAQATWKRLSAKHKAVLAGKQPIIQRTDLGSLGIFYRVQLGPYADQTESQRLCNDFKRSGLDCFVTAQ